MAQQKRYPGQRLGDEKGLVLVVSLMMVAVDPVARHDRSAHDHDGYEDQRQLQNGQSGFLCLRGRDRRGTGKTQGECGTIPHYRRSPDTDRHGRPYIGAEAKAQGKGYNSSNAMHVRVPSIQTALDYTVKIVHATNAAGNLLYWGDSNTDGIPERNTVRWAERQNIYRVTGYGGASNANQMIEVEMARRPPITVPGALYVQSPLNIIGNAEVLGVDQCGGASLPGVTTTLESRHGDRQQQCDRNRLHFAHRGSPPSVLANGPVLNVPANDRYREG